MTTYKKKKISMKGYLSKIYQEFRNKVISASISFFVPTQDVYFAFKLADNSTYCHLEKKGYRIVFGGGTISSLLSLPLSGDISMKDARKNFGDINKLFRALYFHEVAHLIYTDLTFTGMDKISGAYQPALRYLANILEDIFIETRGLRKDFPYTSKYLDFLVSKAFSDEKIKLYSDKNDAQSFLTFLLYKLRRGADFTGTNKFFDDHRVDMLAHIKACLSIHEPTKRFQRMVEFFEWLVSLKEIDFKQDVQPEISSAPVGSGTSTGKSTSSSSSSGGSADEEDITEEQFSPSKSGSRRKGKQGKSDKGTVDGSGIASEKDEDGVMEDVEDEVEYPEDYSDDDIPLDEETICESAFEVLGNGEHEHLLCKDEVFITSNRILSHIEQMTEEVSKVVTDTVTAIKAFKTRNRPKYMPGQTKGKLHIPSVIEQKPVKIFRDKVGKANKTDLAISLLLDNSGSMYGLKSEITTKAVVALATACERMNIPLEINGFTEAFGCCQTFTIKDFNESLNNTKQYIGILSTALNSGYSTGRIGTFQGNVDEVNLHFVGTRFLKTKYQQKVMLVISDGATCGSTSDLKELAETLHSQGLFMIGIGVCDDTVSHIYHNYKIFKETKDLVELPTFLSSMLLSFAKKGVR
jgi:hypothetical protein